VSAAVAAFLYREARLLDERRFEEWRDLFAETGRYWVPARPGQTDSLHEVSIFDDDRAMMAARIRRLRHPRAHAEIPPPQHVRAVTNIEAEPPSADGGVAARSVLTVAECRGGETNLIMARVTWRLIPQGPQDFRIALKRVDLVNAGAMHRMMTVPF
jgi:benzoate/toluate 1,2-dioxygenase beta subunit